MSNLSALERQRSIYLSGVGGRRPPIPTDLEALEEAARGHASRSAFAYIAGGAGRGETIRNNREGFSRWRIQPRMLRDVSQADMKTELFGSALPAPLLLAPVGVLDMVHPEADLAVARACEATGVPYIYSNQASVPMEDTAAIMPNTAKWFQLYWSKSNDLVASLVQRAEACGCSAITVTLDTTMLGWRIEDLDQAYLPFLRARGIAQYTSDPVFQRLVNEYQDDPETSQPKRRLSLSLLKSVYTMMRTYPGSFWGNLRSGRPMKAVRTFVQTYTNPALNWDQLSFLREHTSLPIILKGILHPDDALRAVDAGMDGLIVSNHGGRQVDGAISSIEALPRIVEAIGPDVPLLLDSGVRSGADMYKALALGASAVCIGRPYAYALAIAGQTGVEAVIRNLLADFELAMRLSGKCTITEVKDDFLVPASP